MATREFDYVLVGGGLQNGLLTLALRGASVRTRIALVEQDTRLGGNHIWCFHAHDLPRGADEWIEPLVVRRWPGYRVEFPNLDRGIDGTYSAITSDRLHEVVAPRIESQSGSALFLGSRAVRVRSREVELDTGETLTGSLVVDARGPERDAAGSAPAGYQKFVGLELALERPHDLDRPVLMDATVDQSLGFRFFYSLPFSRDRMLLEDTYFHESPELDRRRLREEIHAYAERKGYKVGGVVREEFGVLPMPWSGSLPTAAARPLVAGYRGGWFHPGTGYSLPVAARLAAFIANHGGRVLEGDRFAALVREQIRQSRYCHLLNRFLFRWYPPDKRWHIFERFYRMPGPTIERFYALRLTAADRFRLLVGKPPRGLSLRYRLQRRTSR